MTGRARTVALVGLAVAVGSLAGWGVAAAVSWAVGSGARRGDVAAVVLIVVCAVVLALHLVCVRDPRRGGRR